MSRIHPTAFVDPHAVLGENVIVGPFSYVGPDVVLGDGCELHSHVTITGPTEVGNENVFYPQCVIGAAPQDLKFKGGPTRVLIGSNNIFREHVTVHRGTEVDLRSEGTTRIGNNSLLMIGVHVAHDSQIGNHVILANNVLVAGHVEIQDCVNVGGASAMHHFVTVGRYAFVGGMTRMTSDVPPYMKISGYNAAVRAVNTEGMRRWQIPGKSIDAVRQAFRLLFGRRAEQAVGQTKEAIARIESNGLIEDQHVRYLVKFLERKTANGVFGRAREQGRQDSQQDRDRFYRADEEEEA
ncbi:MAG: acyl-ACP--UDP-N-acetylglucosamine O-acyltransferase [Phycisphaerae bacterium]|nr:acyl-ACP--UDP-N-acetylglucosamine O-acyltransferase [Phycisphaerae bacterium]